MVQKSLMITKFPNTISSEKFLIVIFSFLISSYSVICHCVRIHISTLVGKELRGPGSDYILPAKVPKKAEVPKRPKSWVARLKHDNDYHTDDQVYAFFRDPSLLLSSADCDWDVIGDNAQTSSRSSDKHVSSALSSGSQSGRAGAFIGHSSADKMRALMNSHAPAAPESIQNASFIRKSMRY